MLVILFLIHQEEPKDVFEPKRGNWPYNPYALGSSKLFQLIPFLASPSEYLLERNDKACQGELETDDIGSFGA